MHDTHLQLADLWLKTLNKTITKDERHKMKACLNWHLHMCERYSALVNESQLAHSTDDKAWQEELKIKMEHLQEELK